MIEPTCLRSVWPPRRSLPSRPAMRGFTLIELLVVISIIALLAAILFPVFASAREAARQATCISNAREIGTALSLYAEDADENCIYDRFAGGTYTWSWALNPYLGNRAIWRDPSDPNPDNAWDDTPTDTTVSYAYNSWFLNGTSLAAITKPAETLQLVDSGAYTDVLTTNGSGGSSGGCDPTGTTTSAPPALGDYLVSQVQVRHNGNTVAAYVDGHVRAQRRDYLNHTAATEDGMDLTSTGNPNDVYVFWNLY